MVCPLLIIVGKGKLKNIRCHFSYFLNFFMKDCDKNKDISKCPQIRVTINPLINKKNLLIYVLNVYTYKV